MLRPENGTLRSNKCVNTVTFSGSNWVQNLGHETLWYISVFRRSFNVK